MSPLPAATTERLLASIAADRLVLMCGAGLSMAEPSRLPSALSVARTCFDRYQGLHPDIPPALRDNLEALADYFVDRATLQSVFIRRLVPWDTLVSAPNEGHEAVADLLL